MENKREGRKRKYNEERKKWEEERKREIRKGEIESKSK